MYLSLIPKLVLPLTLLLFGGRDVYSIAKANNLSDTDKSLGFPSFQYPLLPVFPQSQSVVFLCLSIPRVTFSVVSHS